MWALFPTSSLLMLILHLHTETGLIFCAHITLPALQKVKLFSEWTLAIQLGE